MPGLSVYIISVLYRCLARSNHETRDTDDPVPLLLYLRLPLLIIAENGERKRSNEMGERQEGRKGERQK